MAIRKYGLDWPNGSDPLAIELSMIKAGGIYNGQGMGMFEHLMAARLLIWPKRYKHRWTELMYRNFIDNDLTVLLGCASSQKTSHAVEFCLLNYWARPDNTLVILSTVNMEKLEIGVWGECKMLWSEGTRLYPWLAGNMIDHKKAISTDSLEDDGVRDMRKGIIGRPCYVGGKWVGLGILAGLKQDYIFYVADECFPRGTLVDTPSGLVPIETIMPGDWVISCTGPRTVTAIQSRLTDKLVKITLRDGRKIICTPDHPFFTQDGWEKACNLSETHYMMSPYETMRILRHEIPASHSPSTELRYLPVQNKTMPAMRESIQTQTCRERAEILRSILRGEMEYFSTGNQEEVLLQREVRKTLSIQETLVGESSKNGHGSFGKDETSKSDVQFSHSESCCRENSGDGAEADSEGREWHRTIESRMATYANVSRSCLEFSHKDRDEIWKWLSDVLQGRPGMAAPKAVHRSGRKFPQQSGPTTQRPKEAEIPRGAWVASVEVLKQDDPEFQNSGSNPGRCRVYNLQVEGHPSFGVNGLAAHNCQFMQEAFSLSWPHLFSNGNVKIIASGNPKHDPDDELGKTAEPQCGWNAMPEPQKTAVWDTKFMGGKCINLVGTDSPNFDVPEGQPEPYPRLIGRKFAKRIAHDHGEASFEFYRLVKGVMKVAFAHSRVITRQLCRDHHAMDGVKWKDDRQTNLYALDPSYGGEDRCVGMPLKFGEDVDGKQILLVMPYRVYKLDLVKNLSAEDQIAEIFAEELTTYNVPPENAFYDAGGKGTIGAAFARKFGHRVPVAVDSGAQPTKRPVREDLFVDDHGEKRLKRCDEHYCKFVSEMWFSARYTIEAGQMRGLLDDVMAEGCARIWEMSAGNKYKVESKNPSDPKERDTLKRRLGKSPDLFDCLVIGVEGARQRGFKIARLGGSASADGDDGFQWLSDRVRKHHDLIRSKQLTYA